MQEKKSFMEQHESWFSLVPHFIQNIFCVQQQTEIHTSLEQHEVDKKKKKKKRIGWTIPLNQRFQTIFVSWTKYLFQVSPEI